MSHVYLIRTQKDGILTDAVYTSPEAAQAGVEAIPPGRGWVLVVSVPLLASAEDVAALLAARDAAAQRQDAAPLAFNISATGEVRP